MFRPLIASSALALVLSVAPVAGLHAEQGSAGTSGAAGSPSDTATGMQAEKAAVPDTYDADAVLKEEITADPGASANPSPKEVGPEEGIEADFGTSANAPSAESGSQAAGTAAKPGNAPGGQDTRPSISEETEQGQPPQGVMDQDTEMQKGSVLEEHLDRREQLDEDQDRSIGDRPAGGQLEQGADEDFPN